MARSGNTGCRHSLGRNRTLYGLTGTGNAHRSWTRTRPSRRIARDRSRSRERHPVRDLALVDLDGIGKHVGSQRGDRAEHAGGPPAPRPEGRRWYGANDLVETPGDRLGPVQERRAARLLADPVHDDEADVGPRCTRTGRPAVVAWPGVQLPPTGDRCPDDRCPESGTESAPLRVSRACGRRAAGTPTPAPRRPRRTSRPGRRSRGPARPPAPGRQR